MRILSYLVVLCFVSLPLNSEARAFSAHEQRVLQAYLAYYGRPADPGGLEFWSDRLRDEGGSLDSIIDEFGVSQEYQDRFGSLTSTQLVTNLYQQLFGRDPDPGGLDYYVGQLNSGAQNLQKISLAILDGSQNEDIDIINNRIAFSEEYVSMAELGEVDALDADTLAELVSGIDETAATLDSAIIALVVLADDTDDSSPRGNDLPPDNIPPAPSGSLGLNGTWIGQEIDVINSQTYQISVTVVDDFVTTSEGLSGVITPSPVLAGAYLVEFSNGDYSTFIPTNDAQYLSYVDEDLYFGVLEREGGTRPEFDYYDIEQEFSGITVETDGISAQVYTNTQADCTLSVGIDPTASCGYIINLEFGALFLEYDNVDGLWQMSVLDEDLNYLGLAVAIMSNDKRYVGVMFCETYSTDIYSAGCSFSLLESISN